MKNAKCKHFASFRKRRLSTVVFITLPLLVLPYIILVTIGSVLHMEYMGYPLREGLWDKQGLFSYQLGFYRQRIISTFSHDIFPTINKDVPVLNLNVSVASSQRLNSDLPLSGIEEQPATIAVANGLQKIKVRYRGDNLYHWFYPKKSWRIKTQKSKPLYYGRKFDLINPRDSEYICQYMDSFIAKKMNLLSPESQMVLLNINRKFNGVYLCLAPCREGFLRDSLEMPGDIYNGDPSVSEGNYTSFFSDPYAWRKSSEFNMSNKLRNEEPPMVSLLKALNTNYWKSGRRPLVDEDYMARFCAFISIVDTSHYDRQHNLRLYLDPLSGLFKMIEWDSSGLTFWRYCFLSNDIDISSNRLFSQLLRNPDFNYHKNKILYMYLMKDGFINDVVNEVGRIGSLLAPFVKGDKMDTFGLNYYPSRNQESFPAQMDDLKKWFNDRKKFLVDRLDEAELSFVQDRESLKFDASGYSPSDHIRISFESDMPSDLLIIQDRDMNNIYNPASDNRVRFRKINGHEIELDDTLYPGRFLADHGRGYRWSLRPTALSYHYFMKGGNSNKITSVSAKNAITGSDIHVDELENIRSNWDIPSSDSVHPWTLPIAHREITNIIEKTVLNLHEDWVIPSYETVVFKPGTKMFLDPGVSIISYGKIIAKGTHSEPITVVSSKQSVPWGVVALNGKSASGSSFSNVRFEGGSEAVKYNVYYSGMVTVYHARDVAFLDCGFYDSVIGDDSLRVAKSHVNVKGSTFQNSVSDSLDCDYSSGEISGCRFLNAGNDAIDLMYSTPVICNNIIKGTGDKGISVGEHSDPLVFNNNIKLTSIGVEVKDGSRPVIINCSIDSKGDALKERAKILHYGDGGHAQLYNCILAGHPSSDLATIDNNSDLVMYNSTVKVSGSKKIERSPCVYLQQLYSLYGIEGASSMQSGYIDNACKIMQPALIFSDTFVEDFTSSLGEWQETRTVDRYVKTGQFLKIRARKGCDARIIRAVRSNKPADMFVIEALSAKEQNVKLKVFLYSDKGVYEKELVLNNKIGRVYGDLPSVVIRRIEIVLPSDGTEINVRRIELFAKNTGNRCL